MGLFEEFLPEQDTEGANISGVAVGIVKENWDSAHPGMVKVEITLGVSGRNVTDWARVAVPYAGKEFGVYFLPEIGSQVLVAFHMGDINCPIVIGCLWNHEDAVPPGTANEHNSVKTIRTRGGSRIVITEEAGKETITVETPGKQKVCLDDGAGRISMGDGEGKNAVTVDTKNGGLEFTCEKKAVFKVAGQEMLVLDGGGRRAELKTGSIHIDGSQDVNLKGQILTAEGAQAEYKGQTVRVDSQTTLNLRGAAALKAESSGIAEVSGAMVKLN